MASQAGPPPGATQAEALIDLRALAANLRRHPSRTSAPAELLTRVGPRLPRTYVPAPDTRRSGVPAEPLRITVQTTVGHG
jgi:hypothetical protein